MINKVLFILIFSFPLSVLSASVTVNGVEWMQLTDTNSLSFAQFDTIYDTTTGELDTSTTSLNGIDFTGWTWASQSDVKSLAESYGINFGSGLLSNDENGGFFNDFNPEQSSLSAEWVYNITREGFTVEVTNRFSGTDYFNLAWGGATQNGGYFHRDVSSVPVPAAVWLFGSGLVGLWGARKKTKLPELPA